LSTTAAVLFVLIVLALLVPFAVWVARFEAFCLTDLAKTSDDELLYFPRQAWLLIILLLIPYGGLLYLRFRKGPLKARL